MEVVPIMSNFEFRIEPTDEEKEEYDFVIEELSKINDRL